MDRLYWEVEGSQFFKWFGNTFYSSVKNTSKEPLCQNTFVIQHLGSRENEGFKLETNLGYLVKPHLNNKS